MECAGFRLMRGLHSIARNLRNREIPGCQDRHMVLTDSIKQFITRISVHGHTLLTHLVVMVMFSLFGPPTIRSGHRLLPVRWLDGHRVFKA